MKIKTALFLKLLAIYLLACTSVIVPPTVSIQFTDTLLKKTDAGWMYQNRLFSGYMIQVETDGRVVYRLPIIEGKEHGTALGYYNTGEKLLERTYVNGKKQGLFRQWWPNGNLRYFFHYKNDRYRGKQMVYFPFGTVQEEKNYVDGNEEGAQKIWDATGRLISNYTVKNKKIYGALSAKDCMPVAY